MGIFPSFKVQFDSPLSPAQVIERLNAGFKHPKPQLAGTFTAHEFYLAPTAQGVRGSLTGKLTAIATGTRIEGTVGLHVGMQAFFGVVGTLFTLGGVMMYSLSRQYWTLLFPGLVLMLWGFFSSIVYSDAQAIPSLVRRTLEE